ncbi:hypothetical protein Mcup_0702 [Metallosphaera cuprina Ar-4]|uniref:Uncharacterized protein n=1 Tax=Metallosphaera cuprina (strain Ar-4) TaxID=1006006 RepID=F4G1J4_METCR|nr:hypothetical protein Mcup_0702 [Metallosphaera cuprina Ar-4]
MLNRDFIVRRGTEGLDSDLPESIRDPGKIQDKGRDLDH